MRPVLRLRTEAENLGQALVIINGFLECQQVIKKVNSRLPLFAAWLISGEERIVDPSSINKSKRPATPFEKYLSSIRLSPEVEALIIDEDGNPVSIESIKIKQLELRVSELEKPKKKKGKKQ